MSSAKILIVHSEGPDVTRLQEYLRRAGYDACSTVSCGRRAIEEAAADRPDVALVDLGLSGEPGGVEVAGELGGQFDVPVIFLTDDASGDLLQRAAASRPCGYLLKTVDPRQALLSIKAALSGREQESGRVGKIRQTLRELRSKARIMDTILNSTQDGVVAAARTGRILFANAQAERLFGPIRDMQPGELYDASERQKKYGLFELDKKTYVETGQLPLVRALRGLATDDREVFIRNERTPQGAFVNVTGRTLWSEDGREIGGGIVFFRDVSREKEAEDRLERTVRDLRYQTQLMQTVFDNMEEGVVIADTRGNFLLANHRREEIVGMKLIAAEPAEWPATFGAFYLDKETPFPTAELPIVRAMRGEETEDVELFIRNERRPAGGYIRARGRPLVENGDVVAGVAIFSDITQYKQAQTELERTISDLRSQAQLVDTVFESISDGVVAADAAGKLTIFNSSAKEIVGLGILQSSPDKWARHYGLFQSDGKTLFATDQLPMVLAMRGEATDDVEMFIRNDRRPEGVYISVNGRPLQGNAGGVITIRDITKRKLEASELDKAMRELRNQSELMEAAFNGISEGLVVVDTEGVVRSINPVGRQIVGFDRMEPSRARLVRKWARFYYPDRQTLVPSADLPFNRAIFHGESINDMTLFFRSETRPEGFFVRASVRPLLQHPKGGIRGAVAIFRDVTAQMQAEDALAQAFAEGRMEMIDTILHNIGNAITSVTTGVDTLQRHLADDEVLPRLRALAQTVKAHQDDLSGYVARDPQGQKLMPLIIALAEDLAHQHDGMARTTARIRDRADHIADIARTQRALDSPHMARKDVNLRSALGAAARVLHDSLLKRGIRVDIDCRDAPLEIRIQESRFHQMMVNLVKNSMEAIDERAAARGLTETPRIRVRAYCEGDYLHLDVIDNGIGIDTRNTRILFSAGYTTKESGSGLGLHSAANFVTGSGGQVHAFSDGIGRGATVRVMLRLSTITRPAPPARDPGAERGAGTAPFSPRKETT